MTRTAGRLRFGAEQGVAQVLTPDEMLTLLNRLRDAESVERAAQAYSDATQTPNGDPAGTWRDLNDALAHRYTRPSETA